MGISTKVAKRIVQHPAVVRPGKPGSDRTIVVSDLFPAYAVVTNVDQTEVVTVVFRTCLKYRRDGATFVPDEEAC